MVSSCSEIKNAHSGEWAKKKQKQNMDDYTIDDFNKNMVKLQRDFLMSHIKTFEETLAGWVDEHPDIHPKVMQASKEGVASKLADLKRDLEILDSGGTINRGL
jgi:hypothetical protein